MPAQWRLNYLGWYVDSDEIVDRYQAETDIGKKAKLASVYYSLRNQDIETRIARIAD
jgi:hypothetical protein